MHRFANRVLFVAPMWCFEESRGVPFVVPISPSWGILVKWDWGTPPPPPPSGRGDVVLTFWHLFGTLLVPFLIAVWHLGFLTGCLGHGTGIFLLDCASLQVGAKGAQASALLLSAQISLHQGGWATAMLADDPVQWIVGSGFEPFN